MKDDPELASKHPPKVLPEHWVELIAYWRSSEAQKQSQQNSMNRDKQGPSHITGRKSFAEVKYELQKKGQPVDKMSVWIKSRNGNDPDVIAAISDYNNLLSGEPEDQRELTAVKDKIFHQVIGPDGHGYCRTYGSSLPSRSVYPGSPTTPNSNNTMIQQQLQEFADHLSRQIDQKIQALRSEMLGATGFADGTSAHSQAQTTSVQLKESIGDGVILVSPEKSGDMSTEEDDDVFSDEVGRDSPQVAR